MASKLILLACMVAYAKAGNLVGPAFPSAEVRYAAPAQVLHPAPLTYSHSAPVAYAQPSPFAYSQQAPIFKSAPTLVQSAPILKSAPTLVHSAPVLRAAPTLVHQAAPIVKAAPIIAKSDEFDPNPQYSFGYDIHDSITGDIKSQSETRNGDSVQGSYTLNEPDGTRRIVDYSADPINGFNAVVRKEPIAQPTIIKSAAPVVAAGPVAYGASPIVKTTTVLH